MELVGKFRMLPAAPVTRTALARQGGSAHRDAAPQLAWSEFSGFVWAASQALPQAFDRRVFSVMGDEPVRLL
ncbi:hypothetical protein ACFZAE_04705 [Streptomyces scabiei]|uniref:hypothetical protein n=1 Tax=Streptomyces scabiei TaxID=1930 RepID=UPI0036E07DA1